MTAFLRILQISFSIHMGGMYQMYISATVVLMHIKGANEPPLRRSSLASCACKYKGAYLRKSAFAGVFLFRAYSKFSRFRTMSCISALLKYPFSCKSSNSGTISSMKYLQKSDSYRTITVNYYVVWHIRKFLTTPQMKFLCAYLTVSAMIHSCTQDLLLSKLQAVTFRAVPG